MDVSDFFVAGGTLKLKDRSYVTRPADDELYETILRGDFAYILTSRQMGKSSLMIRTARRLQSANHKAATIDLTRIGTKIGTISPEQWHLGLLIQLKQGLKFKTDPIIWWKANNSLSYIQRFSEFLREVVLTEMEGKITIFIDEIDSTLQFEFRDDFFAAIRSLYNARAEFEELDRLTIVLLGVASPADLIEDKRRTPFNIGREIHLRKFSRQDAHILEEGLEERFKGQGVRILDRVFYWTDGHPYLTQKLCQSIVESKFEDISNNKIDELVRTSFFTEESQKETNIQFVRDHIQEHPEKKKLFSLYRKVLQHQKVKDDKQSYLQSQLKIAGLVVIENGLLMPNNRIYRTIFNNVWVRKNIGIDVSNISRVISTFVMIGVLLFLGVLAFDYGVIPYKEELAEGCYKNYGLSDTDSEKRLSCLADIFTLQPISRDINYDERAEAVFFNDQSKSGQISLFTANNPNPDDLILVIQGLYQSLADVERTGESDELLYTMSLALRRIENSKIAGELANEIDAWYTARMLVKEGKYNEARDNYDKAIEINNSNAATIFERGLIEIDLKRYTYTLSDFNVVLEISKEDLTDADNVWFYHPSPNVYEIDSPIRSLFAVFPQRLEAITEVITNEEELQRALLSSRQQDYPELAAEGFFSLAEAEYQLPSVSGNIVFISSRDGQPELYITTPNGTELTRLTVNASLSIGSTPKLSPDGTKIAFVSDVENNFDIYVLDLNSGEITRITDSPEKDASPSWSPDGKHLVFESFRDGNLEIYVTNIDGSNAIRLTNDPAGDVNPVWSPSNNEIVFTSNRFGNSDLFLVDLNGMISPLTTNVYPDTSPVWSPDGKSIAFQSFFGDLSKICIVDRDGLNENCITSTIAQYGEPVWSWDGSKIAVNVPSNDGYGINVFDIPTGNVTQLMQPGIEPSGTPTWAPDGERLAFQAQVDGDMELYYATIPTNEFTRITRMPGFDSKPVWVTEDINIFKDSAPINSNFGPPSIVLQPEEFSQSSCQNFIIFHSFRSENLDIFRLDKPEGPDGLDAINLSNNDSVDSRPSRSPNDEWVVFQSNRDGNVELYLVDSMGKAVSRLTHTQANNANSMYGPDAETIVFQSDRNGRFDLFMINQNTGKEVQLTSSLADDVNPFFSPDINKLVFQSNRNGNWDLFVLDLKTNTEFLLTRLPDDEVFPAWSSNGKQIAFIMDKDGATDLYVIDLETDNIEQLTFDGKTINASWSPEGGRIAYQSERSGNLDIYSYDFRDNKEYRVTNYEGNDSGPTWDCDGTSIAFTSIRDGDPNIYSTSWKGEGETYQITQHPSSDKWPQWSPSNDFASIGY